MPDYDLCIDEDIKADKTSAMLAVIAQLFPHPKTILVVGCGSGREAGILARSFGAETVGIDIGDSFAFDHEGSAPARLETMDARALAYSDQSFDLVYSFHALEHIPEPERALAEMARVLKPDGHFIIGTPNRSRLFGYLNAPHPLRMKLKWNIGDWRMRLAGKWRNEAGAHAGFSASELLALTRGAFGRSRDISTAYYHALYPHHAGKVAALDRSGLRAVAYPCVYVWG